MKEINVTVIGSGSTYCPELVDGFLKENRIPHAILIEGDKGTGRHTLANFLAKAAVCSKTSDSFGIFRICLRFIRLGLGRAMLKPNYRVISPAIERFISERMASGVRPCPRRYMSLVSAASTVESLPLMIPASRS